MWRPCAATSPTVRSPSSAVRGNAGRLAAVGLLGARTPSRSCSRRPVRPGSRTLPKPPAGSLTAAARWASARRSDADQRREPAVGRDGRRHERGGAAAGGHGDEPRVVHGAGGDGDREHREPGPARPAGRGAGGVAGRRDAGGAWSAPGRAVRRGRRRGRAGAAGGPGERVPRATHQGKLEPSAGRHRWHASVVATSQAARESTPGPRCGCPPCPEAGPRVASLAIAMVTLLLGPLEVRDETAPVKLGGRKARALLARLALDANRTVPAERLIEDLWGEDPPGTAAKMVQIHVSQLRKALPSGVVVTRPGGYALAVDPGSIDLIRFERLRDAGRRALAAGDASTAGRVLGEALALWRGEALAEFSEPFAVLEAARLAQLRLDCAEDRVDAELALGHHAAVTADLEALVAREPFRERARAQLMLALYRSGRHADALATLQALRRALDEELGLVPSAKLGALEQRILRHDPSLLLEDAAPGRGSAVEPPTQPVPRGRTGAAPAPVVAEKRERRRVTVIALSFADGDALAAAMDDEELDELVRRARGRMAEIVERLGGDIGPASGEQILAAFGIRGVREDDAAQAVRAALELRDAIPEVAGASSCGVVPVRVAVETGMAVVTGDVRIDGMGCSVGAAAARLGAQAPAGAVLLGPVAARAVRGAMVLEPADDGAMAVLGERAAGAAHEARSPFVGREAELALLTERHRRAASGRGQVALVTGEPGIGKSRLVDELVVRLATPEAGGTTTFRCSPDPKVPLHPVAAVLGKDPARWRAAGGASGLCATDAALLETQLAAAAADAEPEPAVGPGDQHGRLVCAIA